MTAPDKPKREHDPLCFRYKVLCECSECRPEACLCPLIEAIRLEARGMIRQAYWSARDSEGVGYGDN